MPRRAETATEVFVRQFRELRKRRGWTQDHVVEHLHDLGAAHWRRPTLTKIERGDRGLSFDEAFELAAALQVPPMFLFAPRGRDETIRVAPKMELDGEVALNYFRGQFDPSSLGDRDIRDYEDAAPEIDRIARHLGVLQLATAARAVVDQRVCGDDRWLAESLDTVASHVELQRVELRRRQAEAKE